MFALNARLAVAALITSLDAVASRAIARATREGFRERQSCLGVVNAIVEEMTTGQGW